ncbi:MAG: UPF0182 family protein [Caldiserica bacterium]|nr:UPF0182 family protein [Caldisericota bacterium]
MAQQTVMISAFGVLLLVAVVIFVGVRRSKFGGWALGLSVALLLVAAAGLVFAALAGIYTDYLFFTEVDYRQVFWTRTLARVVAYVVGAVVAYVVVWAVTGLPHGLFAGMNPDDAHRTSQTLKWTRIGIAVVAANFVGLGASGLSLQLLAAVRQVASTAYTDPIFGHSINFYFFTYPVVRGLLGILAGIAVGGMAVIGASFLLATSVPGDAALRRGLRNRLSFFAGIMLLIAAAGVWFSMYGLLFQSNGVVFGVSNTDQVVRIPLIKATAVGILLCGIVFLMASFKPRLASPKFLGWVGAITLIAYILLVSGIPALYQRFAVKPNELTRETPYLANNIAATNTAFGLSAVTVIPDPGTQTTLTTAAVIANKDVLQNVRLWDWRALADTNEQLQSIRSYYKFNDIDIDRYTLNGKPQEVMIAARELDQSLLPDTSRSFVNDRLVYTHGFGVVANGVSDFSSEGAPVYAVKDIPPVSNGGFIDISEPRIYYGESTNEFAIVKGNSSEFDYPQGDANKQYQYTGNGGIRLSMLNRLAFSFVNQNVNILISGQISSESRIMVYRNLQERVKHIAPFLEVDSDPYIVVDPEGQLFWFGQGYTTSQFFPNSEYYDAGAELNGKVVNYIRNSFMYTVNAFDGTTTFYLIDKTDPIAATIDRVYPGLFKTLDEAPSFVKEHYRYPSGLGALQSRVFSKYHMTDPRVFYGQEDKWAVAKERYLGTDSTIEPYYIFFRLPGSTKQVFSLVTPFTPVGKDNLVGLIAISSDITSPDRVSVIKFSKDRVVYGPFQVEARIDQDTEISKTLTLWNQQGSQVLRGNMLILPVDGSLLYIEPIYLQSSSSKMPQIKKIVAATKDKLVWGDNLDQALSSLLGTTVDIGGVGPATTEPGPVVVPPDTGTTGGTATPGTVTAEQKALIAEAVATMTRYKQYTSTGDYVKAGEELKALEAVLAKLDALKTP